MENEMPNFVRDCETFTPRTEPSLHPNASPSGASRNETALACFQSSFFNDEATGSVSEHFEINL
jgi:hypothetical protein